MAAKSNARLLYPGLADFYATWRDISYTLVRILVGVVMIMHVWGKFKIGAGAVAANVMAKNGLEPSMAFAYAAMFLEAVGGVCLIIGLFTRFFAAALAIEMLIALFGVHWVRGFSVSQGGYEYVLLLGVVLFAIAIRGGGPYSADNAIGKEL
ncbi:MAG: DoxX family protein [Pseudolabrys sp.]